MKIFATENNFWKIIIKIKILSCLLILTSSFSNMAIALNGYVVANNDASIIEEHNECRVVINKHASASDIFVPTRSANEWSTGGSNFVDKPPADVTLAPCNDIIYSWGDNSTGELGVNSTAGPESTPTITFSDSGWVDVVAANNHACGLKSNGDAYCWGVGNGGKLGTGSGSNQDEPTLVVGGHSWKKITTNNNHTCGIRTDDSLYCWGVNSFSRLGDGTTTNRDTPTLIASGWTWNDVSAGYGTCGIRSNGAAYCWGRNNFNQVGDGTATTRPTPTLISGGFTWKKISVSGGIAHACAIRSDDRLFCWGSGANGRQGDGGTTANSTPTEVSGAWTWTDVAAGGNFTCAIRSTGATYCWGLRDNGRLGDGGVTSGNQLTPALVAGGHTWAQITAGQDHACGLITSGDAYCWGLRDNGVIGNGTTSGNQTTPVLVSGGYKWKDIAAGTDHTSGIRDFLDPCETGPIGTRCTSDGAIYAGDTVGGARMYAAACDHGMTWDGATCTGSQTMRQWKTSNTTTAGTTSLTDGVANTDAMATAGIALHPAAQACRNKGAEWYLPARDELDLLYDNLVGQGDTTPGGPLGSTFDFNITGSFPAGWYWASSVSHSNVARLQRFSVGSQGSYGKANGFAVRCVRR